MRLADEIHTRLVPLDRSEGAYARNRPLDERPPYPRVGWRVWYRRNEWDTDDDLHLMRVVAVQDPHDTTSEWAPHLWEVVRDPIGGHVLTDRAGAPILRAADDPWPWVHLKWEGDIPKGSGHAWKNNVQMTWESRLRGSPGWLPLDYEKTRKVRLPHELVVRHGQPPDRSAAVNMTPGLLPHSEAVRQAWQRSQ